MSSPSMPMPRSKNHRILLLVVILLAAATTEVALEHRPSILRPGLRLCAYVAPGASATVVPFVSIPRQIAAHGRTGRRPWLARIPPDGKYLLVPNREDGTLQVFYAASLLPAATIPVAAGPEQVAVLPDSSVAFVSAVASNQISVVDLRRFALLANLPVEGPPADLILKPDGGELYVTSPASNGMEVINTWTHEVAQTLVLGAAPTRGILTSDAAVLRSEEHTSELQSPCNLVCRLLLEKKKTITSA